MDGLIFFFSVISIRKSICSYSEHCDARD